MPISDLPAPLQPIVQRGFLRREFQSGLESRLGYRSVADRMAFPNGVGQTITDTRRGLKRPVETPTAASANTGLDNGMTPGSWTVEQFSLGIDQYNDTVDLNMVTAGVEIARRFVANAQVNGTQARQSLDRLARNTLYFGATGAADVGGYLGGQTRVITALSSPAATLRVDDIRGFANTISAQGTVIAVSPANPLTVKVGATAYSLVGVVADSSGSNVSTAPKGTSGTLYFSANVATSDGAAGAAVVSAFAPAVIRSGNRATTAGLQAGDLLTMRAITQAVTKLRRNNVPTIDGFYNAYLSDEQLSGLFEDTRFQTLFRGAYNSTEFKHGEVFELLGVRFIPTTEAPVQASLGAGEIHRAIVVGAGALVEGDFEGTGHSDIARDPELTEVVDSVAMVTRPPLDRLGQMISQSWYWIGGFALPTDTTVTKEIIPTATDSALKRAVVIESL